jgi:hypothetical protein
MGGDRLDQQNRSIQVHGGEVVLEELVHETVAIADPLEKEAFGAVVEEAIVPSSMINASRVYKSNLEWNHCLPHNHRQHI